MTLRSMLSIALACALTIFGCDTEVPGLPDAGSQADSSSSGAGGGAGGTGQGGGDGEAGCMRT